jgi:hypothetical protein
MICERASRIDIRRRAPAWPVLWTPDGRRVTVTSTPCHFGGSRLWFVCPDCGRRCAILYPWRCRICAKGRYVSELLSPEHRMIKKAYRIRARLGQRRSDGLHGPFPGRPKGMHGKTYSRLIAKAEEIEFELLVIAGRRFGVVPDCLD